MPALHPPVWCLLSLRRLRSSRSRSKEGSDSPLLTGCPAPRGLALRFPPCALALGFTVHYSTCSSIRSSARFRNPRAGSQPSRASAPRRFHLAASARADRLLFRALPASDCSLAFQTFPIRKLPPLPGFCSPHTFRSPDRSRSFFRPARPASVALLLLPPSG